MPANKSSIATSSPFRAKGGSGHCSPKLHPLLGGSGLSGPAGLTRKKRASLIGKHHKRLIPCKGHQLVSTRPFSTSWKTISSVRRPLAVPNSRLFAVQLAQLEDVTTLNLVYLALLDG